MIHRSPYSGPSRKLVLAIDVGTTFSGVSYCILDPGKIPEIQGVNRFPAQEHVGGDSKIPSIIYYDQYGIVGAVGAEALKEGLEDMIEEECWTKAEWFKLHFRPATSAGKDATQKIPPLPPNKTIRDVFADMLQYLYKCAHEYIQEAHLKGGELWTSLQNHTEFVLTHPNGWEGTQQAQMREAAILAGLIPNTKEGRARVHFVTEGEASLNFCVQSGLTTEAMKQGDGVLIVDAGGGTIDISAYGQTTEMKFHEIAAPHCYFQGSIYVTNHARAFLNVYLQDSRFLADVDDIVVCFDKTAKLRFRDSSEPAFIKFGSRADRDRAVGINFGQLKLQGTDVARFFEPSINCIIESILQQRASASKPISSVFLVGGFAASEWLYTQLRSSLDPLGIELCRPAVNSNKAVADGGVSFYIDHFVTARVAKYSYGTETSVLYKSTNAHHVRRKSKRPAYTNAAGELHLSKAFDIILAKNTQVSESKEFRKTYMFTRRQFEDLPNNITKHILCYRGSLEDPHWTDEDAGMYSTLCTVKGDVQQLKNNLKTSLGTLNRSPYFRIEFDVILKFGLTEMTAQLCWTQNGREIRSPVEIVYGQE